MLFRVDAGPLIGIGHLQRCLSLAAALGREGVSCGFLTGDGHALHRIRESGFSVAALDQNELWTPRDAARLLEVASTRGATMVVVDSYRADPIYVRQIREAGYYTVVIDDLASDRLHGHMVVNCGTHATALAYGQETTNDTVFLLGPRYAMLRPEFAKSTPNRPRQSVRKILLTMGGSDSANLVPGLVRTLDALPGDFSIDVVIGPLARNQEEVERAVCDTHRVVSLLRSPALMRPLFEAADMVVSAAGQTLYELARVGCPTVAVATAANQIKQLQVLSQLGVVLNAGWADEPDVLVSVTEACSTLLANASIRAQMWAAGPALVDGLGAPRVAKAMLTASRGGPAQLNMGRGTPARGESA